MNTKRTILIVLALIIVSGLWLGQNHNNHSSGLSGSASTPSSSQPVATNKVSIIHSAFTPRFIAVKQGSTVTWTNLDIITYTVAETDGKPGPDSPLVGPGATYSFTYDQAGTFKYHSADQPGMAGSVTVTK